MYEHDVERPLPGFRAGALLDGRYRLERPLGAGGMGSVWVGRQIALEREVAVKMLHAGDVAYGSRLRREALALAAVHHPSVVQVHDYGETEDGVPYIVMELVRGETLGAMLRRKGSLPAHEAVALVISLLEGLATVHRAGIVHRDIKPDNVVLAAEAGGVVPKLLDFGIARRERNETLSTSDRGLVGTPPYMAPEQVRGGEIDERTDVWATGVLLYTLVAGAPPFGEGQVFEVLRRVIEQPPPYPRSARGVNGRLWSILMGALRKDRAQRIASAGVLREALATWLDASGGAPASRPRSFSVAPSSAAAHDMTAASEPGGPFPPISEVRGPSIDTLIRAKLGDG